MYRKLFKGSWNDRMSNFSLNELAPQGDVKKFGKNQLVATYADDLAFGIVLKGQVSLYLLSATGQEKILITLYASGMFGEENLFSDGVFHFQARVKENAEISFISKDIFLKFADNNPFIYKFIIHRISEKHRIAVLQLASIVFNDQRGCIADNLIRMAAAADHSRVPEGSNMLSGALTQTELATIVGCSRQTVNQILNEFVKGDLIGFCGRQIFIKDMEGLAKYVVGTQ